MESKSQDDDRSTTHLYLRLEHLTRQWWFYGLIFLASFIPPFGSTKVESFQELIQLISYVADFLVAKKLVLVPFMPIFHGAMLALFGALLIWRNRFGKAFSILVGFHFLVILLMQAGAITEEYGLVFYPNASLMFLAIAAGWFWEASIRKNDYTFKPLPPVQYLVVAAAIFSFWNPDRAGDYRLILFLTSTSPIAFCMITTIYLALLCSIYPRVNLPLFRIASYISILIATVTIGMGFFMDPPVRGRHWSLMHVPMLAVALYSLILGLRKPPLQPLPGEAGSPSQAAS